MADAKVCDKCRKRLAMPVRLEIWKDCAPEAETYERDLCPHCLKQLKVKFFGWTKETASTEG